jgi:hypothetical protein
MSLYGCNNKPRPTAESSYVAQAGWSETFRDGLGAPCRVPIYIDIKSAFGTTACQYTLAHATDPECSGCVHRSKDAA